MLFFGGHTVAVVGIGAGLDLIDQVANQRVLLGGAEHQRLLALVDLVHEFADAGQLAVGDDDAIVEIALFEAVTAIRGRQTSSRM
nr:hypothetical protein [Devosia beringensis]